MSTYVVFLDYWRYGQRSRVVTKRFEVAANGILEACNDAVKKHGGIVSMAWNKWPSSNQDDFLRDRDKKAKSR